MNKVILLGNLTRDVELNHSSGAEPLAIGRFALAVNRPYSKTKEVDFINCVTFGKTAENIAKYFKKGSKIAVVGRLQVRNWEDNNGQKRYSTDVVVEEFDFCGSSSGSTSGNTAPQPAKTANTAEFDVDEEDLPF